MKRWPVKPLGELCEVRIGRTPSRDEPRFWGGEFIWATIRDLSSDEITFSKEMISEVAVRECMPEPVPAGTLLFSFKLTIGRMAVAGCPLYTNEAIAALPIRNPAELSRDFLRYALMAESHEGSADAAVLGKVLNKEKVRQLPIPVPPLAEQERIVKLLDEADALRKLRAQADRRTAALLPSLFDEHFGNPAANERNWPQTRLDDLLSEIDSGWSPVCQDRPVTGGEWGVLKLGAVTFGEYRSQENKALTVTTEPRPDAEVKSGDLLFARKNTHEHVAATAYVWETPARLMLPDLIFRLRIKPEAPVHPIYLWRVLADADKRREVQSLANGAAGSMPNISKGRLLTVSIPVPPLPLQQTFARRVAEIRELEAAQAASRRRLDALFASLLHRAFAGEL